MTWHRIDDPEHPAPKDGTWFEGKQPYYPTFDGRCSYRIWKTMRQGNNWVRQFPPQSGKLVAWSPDKWRPLTHPTEGDAK